jgi:hypothetical protein
MRTQRKPVTDFVGVYHTPRLWDAVVANDRFCIGGNIDSVPIVEIDAEFQYAFLNGKGIIDPPDGKGTVVHGKLKESQNSDEIFKQLVSASRMSITLYQMYCIMCAIQKEPLIGCWTSKLCIVRDRFRKCQMVNFFLDNEGWYIGLEPRDSKWKTCWNSGASLFAQYCF